ncbi:hypothetical protein Cgig2_023178 [Carnegiea gigantea]|uniref:Uncharacterized protein n=1 Tax=Carnegiea gigantea TaxID=171969 RepID=A0A9Q1JXL0_9CARY|nr:hypothetical protein Cgig2_023178 [Carnegiea gigantea]
MNKTRSTLSPLITALIISHLLISSAYGGGPTPKTPASLEPSSRFPPQQTILPSLHDQYYHHCHPFPSKYPPSLCSHFRHLLLSSPPPQPPFSAAEIDPRCIDGDGDDDDDDRVGGRVAISKLVSAIFLALLVCMGVEVNALNEINSSLGWRVVCSWVGDDPCGDGDLPPWSGVREVYAVSIVGPFPIAVTNLLDLQRLDLHNNKLTEPIPPQIGRLKRLQILNLRWNKLQDVLPPEIGELKSLTHLHLSYDKMTGIIPSALSRLPRLTYLYFDHNQFSGAIPDAFYDHPFLKEMGRTGELKSEEGGDWRVAGEDRGERTFRFQSKVATPAGVVFAFAGLHVQLGSGDFGEQARTRSGSCAASACERSEAESGSGRMGVGDSQ